MIKPTESVARAIINLENNKSWEEVTEWVKKSFLYQCTKNNHLAGEETIKGQGRAIELEDILKHINNAREYLEKK